MIGKKNVFIKFLAINSIKFTIDDKFAPSRRIHGFTYKMPGRQTNISVEFESNTNLHFIFNSKAIKMS